MSYDNEIISYIRARVLSETLMNLILEEGRFVKLYCKNYDGFLKASLDNVVRINQYLMVIDINREKVIIYIDDIYNFEVEK